MSLAARIQAHPVAVEDAPVDLTRPAWAGPAIGAAVLALAWGAYLIPLLVGFLGVAL